MVHIALEMEELRACLSRALFLAEKSVEPVAWARIAHAFGYVCQRLRSGHVEAAVEPLPAVIRMMPGLPHVIPEPDQRQFLKERLIEMLAIADELEEPAVAIHLNQALFLLAGFGLLPHDGIE